MRGRIFCLNFAFLFRNRKAVISFAGDIIKYIDDYGGKVGSINKTNVDKPFASFFLPDVETGVDTSWISLLFAYASCRGIVQWVINYWIVVDNYYQGLAINRKLSSLHLNFISASKHFLKYNNSQNMVCCLTLIH